MIGLKETLDTYLNKDQTIEEMFKTIDEMQLKVDESIKKREMLVNELEECDHENAMASVVIRELNKKIIEYTRNKINYPSPK